jgi:hypothetical protein
MMLGLTRTLHSIAPVGLSAIIGSSALDAAAPAENLVAATVGALALAGIFSLGACGLVLMRFRYPAAAPTAIAALGLTVVSFLRARDHVGGLAQIGLVDFLLTLGICGRAMWMARQADRQRGEP